MANPSAAAVPSALLVVAAALLDGAGRVLVQLRPSGKQHGGLWEFPGGKVEPGETPEAALARELTEELGIGIDLHDAIPVGFASHPAGDRHLILLLYAIRRWTGEPRPLVAAALAWHDAAGLAELGMPPADRPLVASLAGMM